MAMISSLMMSSCTKDTTSVTPQGGMTAGNVLKKGTRWVYSNIYFDSAGVVTKSGPAYYDTTVIIGDTLSNNTQWFITSVQYNGDIYVVTAVGLRNNEYWKFLRGKCPRFDTASLSPLFRNDLKQDESFESVYCLTAGNGSEIRYKRTLVNSSVQVKTANDTYDCMQLKEEKIVPDGYGYFEYQNYFYHSAYGLIKNEYYKKSKGGTVYKASETLLLSVTITP